MFRMRKHRDFTIPPSGISLLEKIHIGGIQQSILIQAENPRNPILLFIHGGPSMPIPGVSCRSADYVLAMSTKELVKHFVVVFWDQRGTGKSYDKDIPKETMNLGQFISDAKEVTDYLCHRFHQEKIFLAAHSWGTTIALSLIDNHPEKFHAYVGISQIVSWTENDRLGYRWVMERAKAENNQKAIRALTKLGEPPYVESLEQWGTLRKWLVMKYKSMIHNAEDRLTPSVMTPMKIFLKSHDYSIRDIFHSLVSGFKLSYAGPLIQELANNNLLNDVPRTNVPIYFIHGRHETHVFPELTWAYYNQLEAANGKQWFWMEKSSHVYHPDDAKEVERILITIVLKEANRDALENR